MRPLPCIDVPSEGPERARLALLHSNGMCGAFYRPLAGLLAAAGVTSALFDIPGFGGAEAPEPAGWDGVLDATEAAVRDRLGDGGVLVGHSLGGLVALLLAPRLQLDALVLVEPAIIPWRWLARVGAALYVRQVFTDAPVTFKNRGPWFWRLHDPDAFSPEMMQLVLDTHARTDRGLVASLHRELPALYPLPFAEVMVPTLVMRGTSSGPVMAWGQRDLAGRLPHATTADISDAGHWLANERDDAIAAAIVDHAVS